MTRGACAPTERSRARFVLGDTRNPVTASAGGAGLNIFIFKAGGGSTKPRLIDILEHIDVDDRIEPLRDLAGNEWYRAAARADVKLGSLGAERVRGYECGIANRDDEPGVWIRCPDTTMLDAKRTAVCARRNFGRVAFPGELEGDIAAMAVTLDQHRDPDAR